MPLDPTPQNKRGIVLVNYDGSYASEWALGDKPQPTIEITDLAVASKTATSVTLSWTGIDQVTALERATTLGSFSEVESGIEANAVEVTDFGLTESTEYHYRLAFGSDTSNTVTVTTSASVSGDWVVFSGAENDWRSPVPAMVVNYPLPDAQTDAKDYHRNYHGSEYYDVLIDVMFGRWPYQYEIIQGPAWLSVGSEMTRSLDVDTGLIVHTPDTNYGRLYGDPNGDTASYSVIVRVTDQKGDTVDITHSLARNDSAFVEVNSVTGSDTATGAVGDPRQTFATGVWGNDDEDTTFAGKIVLFTGEFDIFADTAPSAPRMDVNKKPVAFVAKGQATFNMNNGNFRTNVGANHDGILFKGIDFRGSRTDIPDNRIIFANSQVRRLSVHDCTFDNIDRGAAASDNVDNPGLFVSFNLGAGVYHENISLARNQMLTNCNVPLIINFDCFNTSVQLNDFNVGPNGSNAILIKDDNENVEVRANYINITGTSNVIDMFNQVTKGTNLTQCVSYNTIIFSGDQAVDSAISWNTQGSADSVNTHDFCNSIVATGHAAQRFSSPATGSNVLWAGSLYVGNVALGGYTDGAVQSVQLTASDFDANGKLTGTARTTYLGTHGAEIAGAAA